MGATFTYHNIIEQFIGIFKVFIIVSTINIGDKQNCLHTISSSSAQKTKWIQNIDDI